MASEGMKGSSSGVSIGNYKGVMLCNRPFAGVTATAKAVAASRDTAPPFKPACSGTEKAWTQSD